MLAAPLRITADVHEAPMHPARSWVRFAGGALAMAAAALLLLPAAGRSGTAASAPAGEIVAVGGGGTPAEVVRECVRLARKRFVDAPIAVVVIPHASEREDRGIGSAEMWRAANPSGTAEVMVDDRVGALAQLEGAHIVWMGGGSQFRLLDHLEEQDLVTALHAAHARGALIGGTSAGAAVLGSTTISGSPDPAPYLADSVERRTGLGFVENTIVDQHFAERQREGRLLTSVLDVAPVLGFGISERTAVVFSGHGLRVLGEGVVVALDARSATIAPLPAAPAGAETDEPVRPLRAGRGLVAHVLVPGEAMDFDQAAATPR